MHHYDAAPWPKSLRVVSLIGTLLIGGAGYFAWRAIPHGTRVPFAETFGTGVAVLVPAILLFAALFVVRGYELGSGGLAVRRLLWSTRVDLAGLTRAWQDSNAMCKSLRLFGNGGLYAVTGLYRNKSLGRYRAFVTDPARSVVLRLSGRTVVVSPADPARFLSGLRSAFPRVEIAAGPPGAAG